MSQLDAPALGIILIALLGMRVLWHLPRRAPKRFWVLILPLGSALFTLIWLRAGWVELFIAIGLIEIGYKITRWRQKPQKTTYGAGES